MDHQPLHTMKTQRALILALAITATSVLGTPATAAGPRKVTIDRERLALLPAADQQRVLYIADRLEAISNMDRGDLTREDRKALREEVNGLKNEASTYNADGGGTVIHISSGLLIIILLLIILL